MADFLSATQLNDAQLFQASNEKRFSPVGAIKLAADSTAFTDFYLPDDAKAQLRTMSDARRLDIPFMVDQQVVTNKTPGFDTIPANLAETQNFQFITVDIFSGFHMFPQVYKNNQIGADFYRINTTRNVLHAMAQAAEVEVLAEMENRKTRFLNFTDQVSAGPGTYTFNLGTDELEISLDAQRDIMFFELEALMAANDMDGQYRFLGSRGATIVQDAQRIKFGPNNSENLAGKGFLAGDRLYESNTVTTPSPTEIFNGFFVRDGGIGVVANHPGDFVDRTTLFNRQWSVSDLNLPFVNMQLNIHVNNQAVSGESVITPGVNGPDSNLTMTTFSEMAFWMKFFIVFPPNSDLDTRTNDIIKLRGLSV